MSEILDLGTQLHESYQTLLATTIPMLLDEAKFAAGFLLLYRGTPAGGGPWTPRSPPPTPPKSPASHSRNPSAGVRLARTSPGLGSPTSPGAGCRASTSGNGGSSFLSFLFFFLLFLVQRFWVIEVEVGVCASRSDPVNRLDSQPPCATQKSDLIGGAS